MSLQHVDETRVALLATELLGDRAALARIIRAFTIAWDDRIHRVRDEVTAGRPDEANATLLSLATTSEMLGAPSLAHSAWSRQGELSRGQLTESGIDALEALGGEVVAELDTVATALELDAA